MKDFVRAQWFRDGTGDMKFFKGGELESGALMTEIPADIVIPWRDYYLLKQWMIENEVDGVVKTDRNEDLKIIHRLLDVVENQSLKGSVNNE